jgi:hypothetical protein
MAISNVFQELLDESQNERESEIFPGIKSVGKLQDIINKPFIIKDFGIFTRHIGDKDVEYIHILMEIDGEKRYLSTKAYRLIAIFKQARKKNIEDQLAGTKALIYSLPGTDGYMLKTVQ